MVDRKADGAGRKGHGLISNLHFWLVLKRDIGETIDKVV